MKVRLTPALKFKSYQLRPATLADLPQLQELLTYTRRAHVQLDWWLLHDWVNSSAFVVATSDDRISGLSLAACDGSPVAWWRALALDATWDTKTFLRAIIKPTLDSLKHQNARALTCIAFSNWLEEALPDLGFRALTQVITLCKNDRNTPMLKRNESAIRPARLADIPAVLAVDQAAFDSTWRYGPYTMSHMWSKMTHIVIAEQEGKVIGYACGDVIKSNGHVVRLAVHPTYQGQSVGVLLLADIIQAFFASGTQAITLNTQIDNVLSQRLYRRFNFRQIGEAVNVWQRAI